jgi:hypothetical protein
MSDKKLKISYVDTSGVETSVTITDRDFGNLFALAVKAVSHGLGYGEIGYSVPYGIAYGKDIDEWRENQNTLLDEIDFFLEEIEGLDQHID